MIKTIIIDDEPYCCETLEAMIGKFCPQLTVSAVLHSGIDALEIFDQFSPQIEDFQRIDTAMQNGLKRPGLPA